MIEKSRRFSYLILIYLAGIFFFTAFRIVETIVYCTTSGIPTDLGSLYWHALWNGFRFDTTISCYILLLPLILMIIGEMARIHKRWYYAIIHYYMMVLYTLCFFVCAADIPFFCYFSQRMDATVMTLGSSLPIVIDMIISEPSYLIYLFVFLLVGAGWWLLGRVIYRKVLILEDMSYRWSIPIAIVLVFGLFTGIRGHLTSKRPIRIEYAVFCSNPFLNNIGLNPVFTFIKSTETLNKDKKNPLELIDLETARRELALQQRWPLAEGDAVSLPEGTNVVIVLMESMSVERTLLGTDPAASLTPCLDSLMLSGITFTQAWSAGTQSDNGIYSTHYGHPSIFKRHPMHGTIIPHMCGLPQILGAVGYSTAYFMPHKGIFDGLEAFFYCNGFDKVFEESSYPKEEIINSYGIPDHLLFHHVIEYLNEKSKEGPFYTTVATCSNHPPYVIPKGIGLKPRSQSLNDQIVEYADWSIGQFMGEASKQSWFDNTLFVFVADHGIADKNQLYDIPMAKVRIPIAFYAPERIQPKLISRLACQIDVAPIILGMLGIDYDNRMIGIDALKYQRKYAVFGTWETLGASDGELLYIYRKNDQRTSLYRYRENETEDVSSQYADRKAALERYAKSMIQMSYQMLMDGTTNCEKPL